MGEQAKNYIERKMKNLVSKVNENPDSWQDLIEFGKFYRIAKKIYDCSEYYDEIVGIASKVWQDPDINRAIFIGE